MSETQTATVAVATAAAPTATTLSGELKAAVVAAAAAHLAKVTSDVTKLNVAMDTDLTSVVTELKADVESDYTKAVADIKAELSRLKADVPTTLAGKIVAGVLAASALSSAVALVGHFVFHAF